MRNALGWAALVGSLYVPMAILLYVFAVALPAPKTRRRRAVVVLGASALATLAIIGLAPSVIALIAR